MSVFLHEYPVTFHIEGSPKRLREEAKGSASGGTPLKQSRIHAPHPTSRAYSTSAESSSSYTLAFLSLSTAQYKFDVRVASQVVYEEVQRFLASHPDPALRLILLDRAETRELALYRQVGLFPYQRRGHH